MFQRSLLILPILFAAACNNVFIQRKYTKGMYNSHAAKVHSNNRDHYSNTNTDLSIVKNEEMSPLLFASSSKQLKSNNKLKMSLVTSNSLITTPKLVECGDTILLNNNRKVSCKVISIYQEKINYKDCRLSARPLLTLSNNEITLIKFENGAKEYFQSTHPQSNPLLTSHNKSKVIRKHNGLALFGYITTLITGILTLIAAPVAGTIITLLAISGIFFLSFNGTSDMSYLISKGFGKFLGVIYLTSLIISVIAVFLLILAFG